MPENTATGGIPESLVTENLKALKLLHQVLMIVAAAVLAFAVRTDSTEQYKAALGELSALKEVSLQGWPTFISQRYKSDEEQNNRLVLAVIRGAGIPIQGHPRLEQPVFADPVPYIEGAKLIVLDAFLSGTRKVGTIKIESDRRYLSEQLKKAVAARNPHPSVVSMSFSGIPSSGSYGLREWVNVSPTGAATLFFVINDQPQTVPNQPVYVIITYSIRSEEGRFALEWIRGDIFGRGLVNEKTGIVFPHLKLFWDRVSSLTQNEATVFLQDELSSSSRGTVSFFGIPVERSLAVWFGPAVCLSIVLFLAFHLRHFRSLGGEREYVKTYPWVPLFQGFWALSASYGSIFLLPLVANVALVHRYGHWMEWSTRLAWVLTVLMLAASVWALVEIHRLRRVTHPRWE